MDIGKKDYKGIILANSLYNPSIINEMDITKAKIEYIGENDEYEKYWYNYKIYIPNKSVSYYSDLISKLTKEGWYTHFWNDENLIIIMSNRYFVLPRNAQTWGSDLYKEYQKYACKIGLETQYHITKYEIEEKIDRD